MNEGLSRRRENSEAVEESPSFIRPYEQDNKKMVQVAGAPEIVIGGGLIRITDGQNEQFFEEVDSLVLEGEEESVLDITAADSQANIPKIVLSKGDLELKCDRGTCVVLTGGETGKGDFTSVEFIETDRDLEGFRLVVHPNAPRAMFDNPQPPAIVMIDQAEGTMVTISASPEGPPSAHPFENMPPIILD